MIYFAEYYIVVFSVFDWEQLALAQFSRTELQRVQSITQIDFEVSKMPIIDFFGSRGIYRQLNERF